MQEARFRQTIAARGEDMPHPRFGIYRNNVGMGLETALAVRYPMLQRLLGELDFRRLMADFVAAGHVPESPVLIDYGLELAPFCGGHDVARAYPFIAELAELESRWWQAYHAAEADALQPAAFAAAAQAIEGLRFRFHPSASLLMAGWPVGRIWQALQRGETISDIQPSPEAVLIWRPEAEVRVEIVSRRRAAFLAQLMAGVEFAAAVGAALSADPGFDLQSEFQALIAAQLITRIDRTS